MPYVCLVFLLHHAERLRHVRVFDGSADFGNYVDEAATAASLKVAARRSFLPALALLRRAVVESNGRVRVGICPSGPLLRSAEALCPPLLRAMRRLGEAGGVEWVAAPWDGSVMSILPGEHLTNQFGRHAREVERLLGARPTAAANTELVYDNSVARHAAAAGMRVVLCGQADRQLGGRSANRLYRAAGGAGPKVIARNVGLSDDWGVRFSDATWACHPLSPETYADWMLGSLRDGGGTICPIVLHMGDLGLTHPKASGILGFTRSLMRVLDGRGVGFLTPSEVADRAGPAAGLDALDVPQATSGWGPSFDLSPWLGNAMQSNAVQLLREAMSAPSAESVNPGAAALADALVRLSAADHLHHLRHRPASGVEVEAQERRRPSPFDGPYDAYIDYTNALRHFLGRRNGGG